MSQRYKITIEYDGTELLGWQKQLDGNSVQGFLEKAIFAFSKQNVEVCGAGRTDAGVHAYAQVAHFDLNHIMMTELRLREAINAHLRKFNAPVSVVYVEAVDDDFHARFSATGRSYIYRITNRRPPLVLDKYRSWWVYVPLNVQKMQEGAKYFIGHHDFSSFRAAQCQANSPIKTLDRFEITQDGENITCLIEARSFLHHQVRNMVGTLKMIGHGALQPQDIVAILEAKNRSKAGVTAPAHGLYLNKIIY